MVRPLIPFAALAAVAACSPGGEHLTIGYAIPVSSRLERFLTMAAADIDSASAGRLTIQPWAAAADSRAELPVARRLAAAPAVLAAVGHSGSKNTLGAAPIYREAGLPLLVPTATARSLRTSDAPLFPLAPPDDVVGGVMADFLVDSLHSSRVAVLYVGDAYGLGIHDGIASRLRARRNAGVTGTAAVAGFECHAGPLAMTMIVRALLRRSQADALVIALTPRESECALRAAVAEAPGLTIVMGDSFDPTAADLARLSGAERRAAWVVSFWNPDADSASRAFRARFRAAVGSDPRPADALAYDALMVVAAGVREGARTRLSLTRWLQSLGTPARAPYPGLTGPVQFNQPRRRLIHVRRLPESAE
ncbi:MAG: ABC transporter substrate-binding protein [Gemmatimonadales bacterium]